MPLSARELLRGVGARIPAKKATGPPDVDPYDASVVARAQAFESAGRLPRFTHFAADVNNNTVLRAAVAQISYKGELILLCGDGAATGSPTALNTILQFYALRLRHVLFVSDSPDSCANLRQALPELACVWTSRVPRTKPQNGGGCVKRFWDMRFYFYDVRKHLVSVIAGELGVNVLQTDSDVAWFANPYGVLKSNVNARANLHAQWDAPFVNAGVFYAQNIRADDGAAWVLRELHRRIALFMYHPEVVPTIVPWARKPFFSNSDEQTLMNDVLISAMLNRTIYTWSTAFFEARYGGAARVSDWKGWASTPEGREQPQLLRQALHSREAGTSLHTLHHPHGGQPATFLRGSGRLFQHYLYLLKGYTQPASRLPPVKASVDVAAVAQSAADETAHPRPMPFATEVCCASRVASPGSRS